MTEPTRILWKNGYCVSGAVVEMAETPAILREQRDAARDLALVLMEANDAALDLHPTEFIISTTSFPTCPTCKTPSPCLTRRALTGADEDAAA